MKKLIAFSAVFLAVSSAYALTASEAAALADQAITRVRVNSVLVDVGPVLQNASAGNFPIGKSLASVSAAGELQLAGKAALSVGGSPLTANVLAKPVMASVGKAIVKGLSGFSGPLMIGIAAYDLLKELNYTPTKQADGTIAYDFVDPGLQLQCSTNAGTAGPWYPSCGDAIAAIRPLCLNTFSLTSQTPPSSGPWYSYVAAGTLGTSPIFQACSPAHSGTVYTRTNPILNHRTAAEQEVIDAIATKSGWPATSNIAKATADAVALGQPIDLPAPTVTGPASIPGPTTVVKNPDGTTTTTTKTQNLTYQGDNITTTTVTNVSNSNPVTNITTNTTSTTTGDTPPPADSASDTPLPTAPKLYTPKYPDGLTGVWNTKKADLMATPLARLPTSFMPAVSGNGGYPTWSIHINMIYDFGTYDVSAAPNVWDFLKLCVLITTMFLCRALIFGG